MSNGGIRHSGGSKRLSFPAGATQGVQSPRQACPANCNHASQLRSALAVISAWCAGEAMK
jgi:hypothetical protein